MSLLKSFLAVVIIGAWVSWDFTRVCVRTFLLGVPLSRQLSEIQPEDES